MKKKKPSVQWIPDADQEVFLRDKTISHDELAEKFGVPNYTISRVRRRLVGNWADYQQGSLNPLMTNLLRRKL